MSEFDFEPDYAFWWNKGNLSYDELCWLLCGVNPVWGRKQLYPRREISLQDSDETLQAYRQEKVWRAALEEFMHHRAVSYPEYYPNLYDLIRKNIPFTGCKKDFVNRAYLSRIPFPKEFEAYLKQEHVFTDNDILEKYKNHKIYRATDADLSFSNITSSDVAFSVLLGINPEFFQRYLHLKQSLDGHDASNTRLLTLSDDDRWFLSEYENFTRHFFYDGDIDVVALYNKCQVLNLWNGHFEDYVSKLYNMGVVFRCNIQEALNDNGIFFDYTHDSWVYRFYQLWYKKRAWTFTEALYLFKGCAIDSDKKLTDLRQNSWLLNLETESVWNATSCQNIDLKDLLHRHISVVPQLEEFTYGDKVFYKPEQIILWLCDNTNLLPPAILVDTIFSDQERAKYYDVIDYNIKRLSDIHTALEAEKQHYIALNKPEHLNQLIAEIMPFWDDYVLCNNQEPSMEEVVDYLIIHNPSLLIYKNRQNNSLQNALKRGVIISAYTKYSAGNVKKQA